MAGLILRRGYEAFDMVVGAVENTTVEFIGRSYEAFDHVVTAAENGTVGFVEAVGQESTKAVPVLMGIALTLLLLLVHGTVQSSGFGPREKSA